MKNSTIKKLSSDLKFVYSDDNSISVIFQKNTLLRGVVGEFDTNLKEHHHFFCQNSGKLIDIQTNQVTIAKLPKLPKGKKFKSVEVIINITS